MYADVPGSDPGADRFSLFFFLKELSFLALGFRGFGFRVRKLGSTIQWGGLGDSPPSLLQPGDKAKIHMSRDYHGNGTASVSNKVN